MLWDGSLIYLNQTRIATVAKNSGKKKSIQLSELFAIEPADEHDDHEIILFKKSNHLNDEVLFP